MIPRLYRGGALPPRHSEALEVAALWFVFFSILLVH